MWGAQGWQGRWADQQTALFVFLGAAAWDLVDEAHNPQKLQLACLDASRSVPLKSLTPDRATFLTLRSPFTSHHLPLYSIVGHA